MEVRITNLEKIFNFFSNNTLCNISNTKVFKYCHFLMLMLHYFETDPVAIVEYNVFCSRGQKTFA